MEQKTQAAAEKAKAEADRKAEARRHLIFGIIAAAVITGLIAMMAVIEEYGQSKMPNVHVQTRDAADH